MNSITLLIIELILCSTIQILLYKRYKLEGIYTYIVISAILTGLMSLKTISIFEYDVNLGIIPLVTIFTSSNILIQKKGSDEIKKVILTISSTFLISYAFLYLVQMMHPSNINLFTNASYDNIFLNSLRIYFTNFVTMLYSLLLNSKIYFYLK